MQPTRDLGLSAGYESLKTISLIKLGPIGESHRARSRTYEPGSYFELRVSPWGHVRCTCPGFSHRGLCKHAEALRDKLKARLPDSR